MSDIEAGGDDEVAAARVHQHLLTPAAALAAGEAAVGGKAYGLARLVAAGAAVPEFFVIPAAAAVAHLGQPTLTGVDEVDLHDAIKTSLMDPALAEAIEEALTALGPGPYAVRSSMVGEDSASHSFAGQLETFLFQPGEREVVRSVLGCWASAFSERARAYRERAGLGGQPRVGVVVQRMIAGRVSGVMFTAHPVSGRRDHVLVTAAWGQGEGIVGGACNTDEFTASHDGAELEARVADKDVEVVRGPSGVGTVEQPVEEARRRVRCLTVAEVAAVAREGVRVANAFGAPQDLEWTFDGDRLLLLQSRPITSLPPARAGQTESGPRVVWNNSNIQESYCGVTTPLTFSFARAAYASVYEQLLHILDMPESEIAPRRPILKNMLGLVRGRVYYNINNWYRMLLILPGFGKNKHDMERMMGLDVPVDFVEGLELGWLDKARRAPRLVRTLLKLMWLFRKLDKDVAAFLANFDARTGAIDRKSFQTASFVELMGVATRLRDEVMADWHTPIVNDFFVMMASGKLRRLVDKTGLPDSAALMGHLMSGEEGIESTEPTRMLMRMAKRARGEAATAAALREGSANQALAKLVLVPWFAAEFARYIDRYGDRCMGELKLETVSLREDPTFLIHVLRGYLERPDLDPDRLMAKEKQQRAAAEAAVRAALPWRDRLRLGGILGDARRAVKWRENMRLARTRGFGLYRDIFLAVGARLHEAGRLDAPRDVFYLALEELYDYLDGRAVSADLAALARARKAEFAGYEGDDMPNHFETVGAVYHGNALVTPPSAAAPADLDARTLRGTGCYPGIVEAPLRVIMSPRDELNLTGKILCTLRTDPGWAPLFPTASGILVERGSTLSHSAVVARELGIPAVVGVPDLLRRVHDGERVRLDGGTGVVERLP